MKIYLTGFMGSGKTHVGKHLATKLQRPFIDLDHEIERVENRDIPTIFKMEGEDYFRKIEQQILKSTINHPNAIISCGGGTPVFFDNMEWMNTNGLTIFLDTSVDILVRRLRQEPQHRPLLQSKNTEELATYISKKLEERRPFYEEASIIYKQYSGKEKIAEELTTYFLDIIGH